jgi:hypothetical protein
MITAYKLDKNNFVENIALFKTEKDIFKGYKKCDKPGISIGWKRDGEKWVVPEKPEVEINLEAIERRWRDKELKFADIEISILEDDHQEAFLWREYRIQLRNWPESEYFPNENHRPKRPYL